MENLIFQAALTYPQIDPVAIQIGPLAIRWYSLAYIFGLVLGWRYCRALCFQEPRQMRPVLFDDFLMWATIGVIVGGRMGYVLFYYPSRFMENPLDIFMVWQGGMSFHGGLLGVILAVLFFAWRQKMSPLTIGDIVACAAPVGLFLGRIANFINGELYGREAASSLSMIFPKGGPNPRHPSQLYESATEGLLLLIILGVVARRGGLCRRGLLSGLFLAGYGMARASMEQFREIELLDDFGFLVLTKGQTLSLPMIAAGLALIAWSYRKPPEVPGPAFKPEEISDKARRKKSHTAEKAVDRK